MTIHAVGNSSELLDLLRKHFAIDSVNVNLKEGIYSMVITGGPLNGCTVAITPDDLLDRISFLKLMLGVGVYLDTLGDYDFPDVVKAIVRAADTKPLTLAGLRGEAP